MALIKSGRGPDSPIRKGGSAFEVVELGKIVLTATGADLLLYSPGARGRILHIFVVVDVATTDTDADGTITAEVNGTAVTAGGVVTLADVNGTAANAVTAAGKYINGTAITGAGNKFDSNDYINVAWATTNAFSDGIVTVFALLEFGIAD